MYLKISSFDMDIVNIVFQSINKQLDGEGNDQVETVSCHACMYCISIQ